MRFARAVPAVLPSYFFFLIFQKTLALARIATLMRCERGLCAFFFPPRR
jgi:hypothetical protein